MINGRLVCSLITVKASVFVPFKSGFFFLGQLNLLSFRFSRQYKMVQYSFVSSISGRFASIVYDISCRYLFSVPITELFIY